MARLTLTHPKSTERHDVTVSEPITERTMVQAGAVMTTQKRKELTYVPRLENPVSYGDINCLAQKAILALRQKSWSKKL